MGISERIDREGSDLTRVLMCFEMHLCLLFFLCICADSLPIRGFEIAASPCETI